MAFARAARIDGLVGIGWPPPPRHPPGQAMNSMKWHSLNLPRALMSSSTFFALAVPWATPTLWWHGQGYFVVCPLIALQDKGTNPELSVATVRLTAWVPGTTKVLPLSGDYNVVMAKQGHAQGADAALVKAAGGGNGSAFSTLVDRHYRTIYALAFSRVGDWSAAEDLAQETFLVAYANLSRLRTPEGFLMWLRRIVRNLSANWIRSEVYRRRLTDRLVQDKRDNEAIHDQGQRQEELCNRVWNAVRALSPTLRDAVVLYYMEDRSASEAARALGTTENAVYNRLHQARKRLRYILEAEIETELTHPPPQTAGKRVTAALALGPAFPEAGQIAAGTGLGFWVEYLTQRGMTLLLKRPTTAATIVGLRKAILALAAVVVVGSGLFLGLHAREKADHAATPPGDEAPSRDTVESPVSPIQPVWPPEEGVNFSPPEEKKPPLAETADPALNIIRGRVVEAESGKGLPLGVTLSGDLVGGKEIDYGCSEDGAFQIDATKLGYGTFTLSCRNYYYYPFVTVEGVRRPGEPVPEMIIEVKELATISGRVLFADGSPVPRANIIRLEFGDDLYDDGDHQGCTDEKGRFVVHHDGGRWRLMARAGMLCSEEVTFELDKKESVQHDFVLPPGGEIYITLHPTDGGEITGISGSFLTTDAQTMPFLPASWIGENRFVVRDLPYDVYSIDVRAEEYAPALIPDIRIDKSQPSASVSAALKPACLYDLAVLVLDSEGNPVSNAGVLVAPVGEWLNANGNDRASFGAEVGQNGLNTDAQGLWTAKGLHAGSYRAYCADVAGEGETFVTVPDEQTATVRLRQRGTLYYTVDVVDALADGKVLSPIDIRTFAIRSDGMFVDGMLPGENWLVVVKEGYTAFIDTVVVEPESPPGSIRIRASLGEGGALYGVAQTADGNAKPYEQLYVYPEALWPFARDGWTDDWKDLGRTLGQGARTDLAGQFTINHLPEGRYVVVLSDGVCSAPIEVAPGYETGPVTLVTE
jgi:RNA polymerase sigma-70 factor (ECF subfamily)